MIARKMMDDIVNQATDREEVDPGQSPACDGERPGEGQEPPRKRARLSCNTCKARKTKCIGIETGACHYCRSLNLPCEASIKNRKRPFYRVSSEVYDYSIKLLRRFVPEEELPELTVEKIQEFLRRLDAAENREPNPQAPRPQELHGSDNGPLEKMDTDATNETMEGDEHPVLQEGLGCMLLDSMGKYRYVGANSSIRWFNAIHTAREPREPSSRSDPRIISPLKFGPLPPSPDSGVGSRRTGLYFPPRQYWMDYVGRFFEQVYCTYWFYSAEDFYPRLEQTIEEGGATASASWLCSIYSIFAIGSMRPSEQGAGAQGSRPPDCKTPADYLALAREVSAGACDEADLDSVKAFGLLGLATHATCYSIAAYLHLGTAVKIAFSLGLHRDVFLRGKGTVERERSRRLWWTIYMLDYEMASRFGYPCSIIDDAVFMSTPPATEQILSPGPNTPLGYQALLVSLVRMTKTISHECFLEPAHMGGRLPISRVTKALASLRRWHNNIPTHLQWDSSVNPQHRRAVPLLHLRFWATVISLVRPFLLFTVARSADTTVPAKRILYEQMSNTCIEAAESAVKILRRMREEQTLSSLVLFDSHFIGEVMGILIMALQKRRNVEHQGMLQFCLETFRGMEKIGWCEKLSPELESTVHASGVLPAGPLQPLHPSTAGVGPGVTGGGDIVSVSDYQDINFDGCQFDVFETLDLDPSAGLIEMFTDASFSGSQFLFNNPDRLYQV